MLQAEQGSDLSYAPGAHANELALEAHNVPDPGPQETFLKGLLNRVPHIQHTHTFKVINDKVEDAKKGVEDDTRRRRCR